MAVLHIDGLDFCFPEGWRISKYDEWSFYRNQFCRDGIKAVDALALSPKNEAFLIEVKDYRLPEARKPSDLPNAVAEKVLHTLAALLPARLHANNNDERQVAGDVLGCISLKVVVHIEQPKRHQPVVDLADIKQKIRGLLRAVDSKPKITSMSNLQHLAWSVS